MIEFLFSSGSKSRQLPAENPERMDFILRAPLPENWDMTDGDAMVSALKEKSLALIDWVERKME